MKRFSEHDPLPTAVIVLFDILLIGAGLVVFALSHHVLPKAPQHAVAVVPRPTPSIEASAPAESPAAEPTDTPTSAPTAEPTDTPTDIPTGTPAPTGIPTGTPTLVPTATPTGIPTGTPTLAPTATPTGIPTGTPTIAPTAAPTASPTPVPTDTPTPAPTAVGDFSGLYPGMFTFGAVSQTENSYISSNLNITARSDTARIGDSDIYYHVFDIYIRDIECLKSAFAGGQFAGGSRDTVRSIAESVGAVCAVNGDYCCTRSEGVVLRNGELYRRGSFNDICVIFWDGRMKTYEKGDYDLDALLEEGAYQIWDFGPALLEEDGTAKTSFNTDVAHANPRTVIGYYAQGHYCLLTVDGRSSKSEGANMTQLAALMEQLGCAQAYNLDGGQSSVMVWNGEVYNEPYEGGRRVSDIVCITDG